MVCSMGMADISGQIIVFMKVNSLWEREQVMVNGYLVWSIMVRVMLGCIKKIKSKEMEGTNGEMDQYTRVSLLMI